MLATWIFMLKNLKLQQKCHSKSDKECSFKNIESASVGIWSIHFFMNVTVLCYFECKGMNEWIILHLNGCNFLPVS